jgi:AbrB family looped-hinge helix DNA binding protein
MKTTIDGGGRVVIPKEIRDHLALDAGAAVEIRELDGRIEIEPVPTPMSLVRRRGGTVAVPAQPLPPLTDEIVRDAIERTRR